MDGHNIYPNALETNMDSKDEEYESHNADTFKRVNGQSTANNATMTPLHELFSPPEAEMSTPNSFIARKEAPPPPPPERPSLISQRSISGNGNSKNSGHPSLASQSMPLEIETREHLRNISAIPVDPFLIHPHESEAEANVLKAIEQRAADNSSSNHTISVFRHVPDDAVDMLSIRNEQPSKGSTKAGENTMNDSSQSSKPTRLPLQKERHRRNLTLEGALTDVAMLLSAVHQKDHEDRKAAKEQQQQQVTNDNPTSLRNDDVSSSFDRAEQHEQAPLLGSAEAFAQNAMKLHAKELSFRDLGGSDTTSVHLSSVPEGSDEVSPMDEEQPDHPNSSTNSNTLKRKRRKKSTLHRKLNKDLEVWRNFFHLQRKYVHRYLHTIILYIITPAIGVSALLYYALDNPMSKTGASMSWWILFICVRQILILSLALATQAILIDFLALGTRVLMYLLGPVLTLCIVQSKGWPFVVFWCSVYNFALLYESRLAEHWLYWQSMVGLFNDSNPSGDIVRSAGYRSALLIALSVSLVVMVKRFVVGLYLGRQTFLYYGEQLTKVLTKMLLVSEVASLAKDIEIEAAKGWTDNDNSLRGLAFAENYYAESNQRFDGNDMEESSDTQRLIDPDRRDALTGSLHDSERMRMYQLLDQWEEPEVSRYRDGDKASISALLNFRKALAFIQKTYPFSFSFGPAQSREQCVESSQKVYERLMKRQPDQNVVHFETLALLALDANGAIDQSKAKDLMRTFRPDRKGVLTMLDFVRSVDTVYREYRFLSAGIENAAVLDHQIENVFNWIFYAVIVVIIMSQLGLDPLAFFLSLSSIIVAFAFMIGNSASKFVDGISFIVGRRPYSIGDLIYFATPESPMSFDGQPPYMVRNISLFETTAVWLPTNEHCSFSNGSLATTRVVNLAHSPNPQFFIKLKLPIDTPYDKILILKAAVEEFMKARPREWLSLNGFRAERIDASKGWIEYVVVAMGRSAWQEIGQVLDSKANLSSYCQEVCKQLDIHYLAPPLPVNLRYNPTDDSGDTQQDPRQPLGALDNETRAKEFRQIAQTHNIRLN